MKNKIYSVMLSGLMITAFSVPSSNAAYEDYTEEEIEKINSDMRSYVDEEECIDVSDVLAIYAENPIDSVT